MAPTLYLNPTRSCRPRPLSRPRPHLCSLHRASSSSSDVTRVTRPQATGSLGNPEVGGAWQESGGGASASLNEGGAVHRCPLPGPPPMPSPTAGTVPMTSTARTSQP